MIHVLETETVALRLIVSVNICQTNERRKFVTQIHADLVFQPCISFLGCFRTLVAPLRKILVYTGMLPCLVPSWPQMMQIRTSFRSRSALVLISDNALDFPISLYRRVSHFVAFQTKVVHLCFCLVCIKMPLLKYFSEMVTVTFSNIILRILFSVR